MAAKIGKSQQKKGKATYFEFKCWSVF